MRITANVHVFCVQLLWCEAFCTWVSDGECCSDTVGGTEVNCVCVCVCVRVCVSTSVNSYNCGK